MSRLNAKYLEASRQIHLGSKTRNQLIGNAGNISVQTDGDISLANLSGIFSTVESGAVGNGGTIDIKSTAGSLNVTAGAELETVVRAAVGTGSGSTSATPAGQGNAGNINIQVGKDVTFDGVAQLNGRTFPSAASSTLEPGAQGKAGDITIATRSLSLTNGARLESATGGTGNAGIVNIHARDSVSFDGAGSNGVSSGVNTESSNIPGTNGQAGDITVTTAAFRLTNGAVVSSRTGSSGDGGKVTINARTFEAANGGQVLTRTSSSGKAGDIVLHVTDSVTLSGSDPTYAQRLQQFGSDFVVAEGASSGLFANTDKGSTGQGGTISIDPNQLTIEKGATISVSSTGSGSVGNIIASTNDLLLSQGTLTATSGSGKGGNIQLQIGERMLLRNGSDISTSSGSTQAGGNGGNITITAPFVIAIPQENSHIRANAYKGDGGIVTINTSGTFGIPFQKQPTSESDITASSTGGGINGVVKINTPINNPSYGVAALPAIPINVNTLIANTCLAGRYRKGGSFIVTGSGGLPTRPGDPLVSPYPTGTIRSLPSNGTAKNAPESVTARPGSTSNAAVDIVPATGWVFNNKGQVLLTAQAPSAQLDIPWLPPTTCHAQ